MNGLEWLFENGSGEPREVPKPTQATRAWFDTIGGQETFLKWYPATLQESWVNIEIAIAGGKLHSTIIPLWQGVSCSDGMLLIYKRVGGENLGLSSARKRFAALPIAERATVVIHVSEALTAICEAGFMVVDWYEGNMIYDFDAKQIWLFDWELCRPEGSFILEMDSNYGSSRLMAPEEFIRGSILDQVTLIFNLGRYTLLTIPELAESLAPILARATYPARAGRYPAMREFVTVLKTSFTLPSGDCNATG